MTYQQHWTQNITWHEVGHHSALAVNLELERERLARAYPLLQDHGLVFSRAKNGTHSFTNEDPFARCFDVALALSRSQGLHYVEGVVMFQTKSLQIVPILHGWCCTNSGVIVDPILHKHQDKTYATYTGIVLNKDYVVHQAIETGFVGVLDGRLDGERSGVYFDHPDLWKESLYAE